MNPGKLKVIYIIVFYLIFIPGDFSPNFTTTDTISIPVGAMYLHARTFCTLTDMTFIPMGVMYLHARRFCT